MRKNNNKPQQKPIPIQQETTPRRRLKKSTRRPNNSRTELNKKKLGSKAVKLCGRGGSPLSSTERRFLMALWDDINFF
ncbi:MAG TPA: hypothetical protein ENI07_23890 [Desulfobacterales bacterium]|nr:hypothetical protein [Desulfobacterales bacterium]